MNESHSDALVFFGATGDLAFKKIFSALQAMVKRGELNVPVIGVGRSAESLDDLRGYVHKSVEAHGGVDPHAFESLARLLTLQTVAGSPAVLDLVHLGLGAEGHTASLLPDDSVLGVTDADVAPTGLYQGRRRMTLTYPILNRARRILWVVTGGEKREMLASLRKGDMSIPAGRVSHHQAPVLADGAAAGAETVR